MGRPCTFTPDKLKAICGLLEQGNTLIHACSFPGMPCDDTVRAWCEREDIGAEVTREIARARAQGEHRILASIVEIADQSSPESVQVDKLRVDVRLKFLARANPDLWSEKARTHVPVAAQAPTVMVVGIEPRGLQREALEGEAVALRVLDKPD